MVSDGVDWQFLRLDGKTLLVSARITSLLEKSRLHMYVSLFIQLGVVLLKVDRYRFVDAILEAAVASSPHTTPKKRFPATNEAWTREIESGIFGIPSKLQKMLQVPNEEFWVEDSEEEEGDSEEEEGILKEYDVRNG
jgi:hypothetical protein